MKVQKEEFPLSISLSYKKLFDSYRTHLESDNDLLVARAKQILAVAKKYPILESGIPDLKEMEKLLPQIEFIMEDLFSSVLGNNEIKAASFPFQDSFFKSTQRYKNIIKTAGKDFDLELMNFSDDEYYIMGCSIILGVYYGYNIDFRRPFYYKIPDANGILRSYRVLYNADFIEIEKTKSAIDITKEDVDVLLESFNDISKWKEKFPPKSWNFKGFVILNMFDVTLDTSISDFKTGLIINDDKKNENTNNELEEIFRSLFNLKDLRIGFSNYIEEEEALERIPVKNIESFIINGDDSLHYTDALCSRSYAALFKNNEFYCVSNVSKYHKLYPDNALYKQLKTRGIESAIITAMVDKGKVLGLFEIVSPNINDLNTINANKLKDIMPFLIDSVVRRKKDADNKIELIIQEECTSIHNSVHWKFKLEAKRYLKELINNDTAAYQEVVFDDVYPLFGQIDIKGSSIARNNAVKKDLTLQLNYIKNILLKIKKIETLPIYDH
ncbi:MAG: GAF domain-containing protein, partial [Flavobacteriaceae bacterium]|nr:GAF domain-containing protein [Flavobacteriaceae bacterium]